MPDAKPVNIFIAYAHADEAFLRPLRKHLEVLEDDGVSIWYDGEILPGEEWDASIKKRLREAHIILLLVSIDFLTSDYVKGTELPTALSRHAAGACTVVPVIVRNCLWQKKLGNLQALPKEALPVADWPNADNAFHNVVEGVDRVIEEIKKQRIGDEQAKIADERRKKEEKERVKRDKEEAERRLPDPFSDLMVFVEGGTFNMGSNDDKNEKPIHRVIVPDFYICKYPVTQGQWKQIAGNNPAHFKGEDDRPIENISWNDAQSFIKKLNEVTGQKYRLPSEAEWEYAARGGNRSRGYKYAGSNDVWEVAWFLENSGDKRLLLDSSSWTMDKVMKNNGRTHPVGQKMPNELGLYDMSGNVWEYCEDFWHSSYYEGVPIDGKAWITKGVAHYIVARGGAWPFISDAAKCTFRNWTEPYKGENYYGFRLAKDK